MFDEISMDDYKFRSLIEECINNFEDWNPRSLNKLKEFLEEQDPSYINKNLFDVFHGKTALRYVLFRRNCPLEIVRLLLSYGATLNPPLSTKTGRNYGDILYVRVCVNAAEEKTH